MENKYVEMRCDLSAPLAMGQEQPEGITLVPLGEVDEETLYTCYHAAFVEGDATFFFEQSDMERREYFETLELGQAVRESASSALFKKGDLVGFTYVLSYGEGNLHISCMCVHPDFKRQGLAKFMLQHAQRQARADGYRSITLGTDTLMGAFQLYAKNGFEIIR